MSRSIFDPTGDGTERSGSRNLGPDADNISHMPPDAVDGEVNDPDVPPEAPIAQTDDEAAARLRQMTDDEQG